jgi:hypothetical protein
MAIEEEFSIEIPDKDADSIHSSKLPFMLLRGDIGNLAVSIYAP